MSKKLDELQQAPLTGQDTSGGNSLNEEDLQSKLSPLCKVRAEQYYTQQKSGDQLERSPIYFSNTFEQSEQTIRQYEMTLARLFSEF